MTRFDNKICLTHKTIIKHNITFYLYRGGAIWIRIFRFYPDYDFHFNYDRVERHGKEQLETIRHLPKNCFYVEAFTTRPELINTQHHLNIHRYR